jgi:elongation factor Ts
MTTTIELIKQLREETGAGVLACRRALEENNANYALALADLREQAQAAAAKKAGRQASQGTLELYSHANGRIGVMVEVNCETDFAGRSPEFRAFAHEIALQLAAAAADYLCDEDIPPAVLEEQAQKAASRARAEGKPAGILPRIVEGTLKKYKDEHVLLRQAYIRDDSLTIADLLARAIAAAGENIVIRRFVRWELNQTGES